MNGCCYEASSDVLECAPAILCGDAGAPGGPSSTAGPTQQSGGSGGVLTPITTCNKLSLVGDDGQFLGVASSSSLATDGVCNDLSSFGGKLGTYSIFNDLGNYGSSLSSKSAYNELTSTPPRLRCESGTLLNPVTKNTLLANRIDPDVLCDTLEANGY
jgi:hypothetical protein